MKHYPTVAIGIVEDVLLWANGPGVPDEDDFNKVMEFIKQQDKLSAMVVVTADNATLNSTQRKSMNDLWQNHGLKMAVLTTSRLARGVLTALKWFGVASRHFEPSDLSGALEYCDRSNLYDAIHAELEAYMPPNNAW